MNNNKTVVINGQKHQMNLTGIIDLTNKNQIDQVNKKRKEEYKKSFSLKFGIRQVGAGDVIDYLTRKTGIKWLILKLIKNCGCEKRRQYFNKWNIFIPYVFVDNKLEYPREIKVQELTTVTLDNGGNEISQPISRDAIKNKRKPCNCGANRL